MVNPSRDLLDTQQYQVYIRKLDSLVSLVACPDPCYSKRSPWTSCMASPGSLLEMQTLMPHPAQPCVLGLLDSVALFLCIILMDI